MTDIVAIPINPAFEEINKARTRLKFGYVNPGLRIGFNILETLGTINNNTLAVTMNTIPRGRMTEKQYANFKGAMLLSYLETCFKSVSPIIVRAIMIYEPRLCCSDVACAFLNSGNVTAVREMELCGYAPDENLVKELVSCLKAAEYKETEYDEICERYTPVIDYLISKGFEHIINHKILITITDNTHPKTDILLTSKF